MVQTLSYSDKKTRRKRFYTRTSEHVGDFFPPAIAETLQPPTETKKIPNNPVFSRRIIEIQKWQKKCAFSCRFLLYKHLKLTPRRVFFWQKIPNSKHFVAIHIRKPRTLNPPSHSPFDFEQQACELDFS